jgi:hypothetical protein
VDNSRTKIAHVADIGKLSARTPTDGGFSERRPPLKSETLGTIDLTLPDVLRRLQEEAGDAAPAAWQLNRACVRGRIPAARLSRGWIIAIEDMDAVRHAFGLPTRKP